MTKQQFMYMLGLMETSIIYIMTSLLSGDGILLMKKSQQYFLYGLISLHERALLLKSREK